MRAPSKPPHAGAEWDEVVAALLAATGLPSCHPGDYAMHTEDPEMLRTWVEGIGFLYDLEVSVLEDAVEAYITARGRAACPYSVGDSVEVLAPPPYDHKRKCQPEPVWTPGFEVIGVDHADDQAYHIDVRGNGKTYLGCSPLCVRPAT